MEAAYLRTGFHTDTPGDHWRETPEGHTPVRRPQGRFLISTRADSYIFQFEHVDPHKFCGMPGEINGTMTVNCGAKVEHTDCSIQGVMDANDAYLENLYGKSPKLH